MGLTLIEWTAKRLADGRVIPGYTFNGWLGCSKVSDGCGHCYITRTAPFRTRKLKHGAPRLRTSDATWYAPRRWNREAAELDYKPRVFCMSLADVFDAEVPDAWFCELAELICDCKNLTWMLLTKRPENIMPRLMLAGLMYGFPDHVQIGVSIENQKWADLRRDIFKDVPAAVKFVSYEPALGPVDWTGWGFIDGLICGGESGDNEFTARPMHPDWARAARDWCVKCHVPFFFKQWGHWLPQSQWVAGQNPAMNPHLANHAWPEGSFSYPVKSKSCRIFDGGEFNLLPEKLNPPF